MSKMAHILSLPVETLTEILGILMPFRSSKWHGFDEMKPSLHLRLVCRKSTLYSFLVPAPLMIDDASFRIHLLKLRTDGILLVKGTLKALFLGWYSQERVALLSS